MNILSYSDYMQGFIAFISKEDEMTCLEHWGSQNEMTVDDFGRVYNEGGIYIANIKI
ncbi:hypothetical protein IX329_000734 [Fusobacterium necrophorum]|nr:hypothetical protein [Fusobacterium necrophorum]MBR8733161.1 hypothetical protein [Fusobacterium necrophorum]MBR8789295.1 hypothetical protein [Fusobacterium necrophorum]